MMKNKENLGCINPDGKSGICYSFDRFGDRTGCYNCELKSKKETEQFMESLPGLKKQLEDDFIVGFYSCDNEEIFLKNMCNDHNSMKLENDKLRKENWFLKLNNIRQLQILLTKYWLQHSNDCVYDQFKCNYVPETALQDEARKIIDIEKITIEKVMDINILNKAMIEDIMGDNLSYKIL